MMNEHSKIYFNFNFTLFHCKLIYTKEMSSIYDTNAWIKREYDTHKNNVILTLTLLLGYVMRTPFAIYKRDPSR